MSEVLKRLRERRANVWEQAKELADRAAEENRQFSGDEESQWQGLNSELDALDKRIKNVIDGEQRAKDTEDAFAKLEGKPQEQRGGRREREQPVGGQQESELRRFLRGDGPRFFDVVPDGPVNFRAFLNTGTAAEGGNTVPTSFYDRLVAHLIETSAVMQAGATMLNTASGETIQVPKTTGHSTAGIVTEGANITPSDPTFGQISLGAYKYGTLTQVSRELIDDSGVDLEGYLASQTGRALGNAFGAHAITGTGTGQPRGLVTDATVGITGATTVAGKFNSDNLIDLFYSVIAPYRASPSCKFIARDSSIAEIRKLKDGNGQYYFQPSLVAGTPDTLIGKPILTDPNVAEVAVGGKSLVFGDMSQYFVRLAGGVRFERSDDYAFNTDLVTFRALLRADAALVDLTGAVKVFQGAAT
ncbi:phage major capsid protein [Pseudonocardia parietis]|uniref:HK97 family phage major capsid protein n=1 Tax=Pseudonocardia parietis TaxID=570936 RepID=A0ABS4W202_9PSEU|nr:phage major capsid protein [Pseudonocardia parietis]MBP2370230.1 HK97 family phage major capsid protein [Pseudonocardia parietis]